MAIRNIIPDTDEILHKKCRKIEVFDDRIKNLATDMIETLQKSQGIGLAGPQVGMLKRIFVLNTMENDKDTFKVFINPEIIETEGEQEAVEACLSIVGFEGVVIRPQRVKVKAFDVDGNEFTFEGEDLMARALCHESDHLDGKTIRDTCEYEVEEEE